MHHSNTAQQGRGATNGHGAQNGDSTNNGDDPQHGDGMQQQRGAAQNMNGTPTGGAQNSNGTQNGSAENTSNGAQQGGFRGLTLYEHLLDPADKKTMPPGTIVAAPVLYTEEQKAAQRAKINAGLLAPSQANRKRQLMLAAQQGAGKKKKFNPGFGAPGFSSTANTSGSSSSPDKPTLSNPTPRMSFDDFAKTKPEDLQSAADYTAKYHKPRGRGGWKNRNKKNPHDEKVEPLPQLKLENHYDPRLKYRYQNLEEKSALETSSWSYQFLHRSHHALAEQRVDSQIAEAPTSQSPEAPTTSNTAQPEERVSKGRSVAEKLMAKMGHEIGKGLGAKGDGMLTPLFVQRTKKYGEKGDMGRIVGGKGAKQHQEAEEEQEQAMIVAKEPEKEDAAVIVVLGMLTGQDMVADAAADDGGIRQKIGRQFGGMYGSVERIVPRDDLWGLPVFIKFMKRAAADDAMGDCNLPAYRFNGNKCYAELYDLAKFEAGELTAYTRVQL